jgi:hypothetical protein
MANVCGDKINFALFDTRLVRSRDRTPLQLLESKGGIADRHPNLA